VSTSTINTASAAIKWKHEINGYKTPCQKPILTRLKKAFKRDAPIRESKARIPFTGEETRALRRMCKENSERRTDRWGRLLCILSLIEAAGFRINEALALRIRDVDWKSKESKIHITDSKGDEFSRGSSRTLINTKDGGVGERAFGDLKEYMGSRQRRPDEFIFREEKGRNARQKALAYSTVRKHLLEACSMADINLHRVGWHGMRKTAAAGKKIRSKGEPKGAVGRFLGHAKGSKSTKIYLPAREKKKSGDRKDRDA
jgi:integrase